MIKLRNLNQIMTEIMPEQFRTLFRYEVFRYDERQNGCAIILFESDDILRLLLLNAYS